jgi:hypothetical protein
VREGGREGGRERERERTREREERGILWGLYLEAMSRKGTVDGSIMTIYISLPPSLPPLYSRWLNHACLHPTLAHPTPKDHGINQATDQNRIFTHEIHIHSERERARKRASERAIDRYTALACAPCLTSRYHHPRKACRQASAFRHAHVRCVPEPGTQRQRHTPRPRERGEGEDRMMKDTSWAVRSCP